MEQKELHAELLKFAAHIARLNIWDYGNDDGSAYKECDEPSDGYLDSHTCLMDMIETARRMLEKPASDIVPIDMPPSDRNLLVMKSAMEALLNVPVVGGCYDQQHSDTHMNAYLRLKDAITALPHESANTPAQGNTASTTRPDVTLVADTYATDENGDSPSFAVINVDAFFASKLISLSAMCKEHRVASVVTDDTPEKWDNEDDLRIQNNSLTVTEDEFWFSGYPKHANYSVETRSMSIAELLRVIEMGKDDPAHPSFKWDDGILFYSGCSGLLTDLIDEYRA